MFRSSSSRNPTLPRRMPAWLVLSPWFVVACALLLAAVVLILDFRDGRKETEITTRIYLERGASLIQAFEATLQTGMGFRWTDEELQGVLDGLGTGPDVYYVAVTNEQGHVLAASRPGMSGTDLLSPEEMKSLRPVRKIKGDVRVFQPEDGEAVPVFQVYQLLSARQYAERLHGHMMMGRGRMARGEDGGRPLNAQRLVAFVGYDMTSLFAAQRQDARRAYVHWAVLAFLGLVGLLTLFLVKGYQRSRRLVQETSAFSFALIDTLPLGIVATDEALRVTTFNPEAERITGLAARTVLGRTLADALPGLWGVVRESGLLKEDTPAREHEVRCVFGQERRIPLALNAVPVTTDEGRRAGWTLTLRVLGEIRRLQAEVRRQDRLAALGSMAAGVAHEIRNPLGAIKGLARFFREVSPPDSEEARVADIMTQEVLRLDGVVGDLLELARPDRLNLTPTSLRDLVDKARRLVQSDMDKHGVTFTCDMPVPCPVISLDADRMTQVLLNLFLNAVQAMPDGGLLSVRGRMVSASPGDDGDGGVRNGDEFVLDIMDEGEGIAADKLQEIFSPYYTTKPKGTGLGLSLVHKIMEAHDGCIEVKSEPGRGAMFSLRLPVPVERTTEARDGGQS